MPDQEETPYDEEAIEPNPDDSNSTNVMFRAGYVRMMADKLPPGDDQTFLRRASRSLVAFARKLQAEGR